MTASTQDTNLRRVDVAVVGAGMGGIYALNRFIKQGLSVVGFESAPEVGGVWYHNRYPGARVDVESYYYSLFDPELYREWTWSERYSPQPEILAYLKFAADSYGIRDHIHFNTWVTGAEWDERHGAYLIQTDTGLAVWATFLVMATGQLSKPKPPQFEGLSEFSGEWVQTSNWPEEDVDFAGKRVAVIGTGSSGVQVFPVIAEQAAHAFILHRTANYSVPAKNGAIDPAAYAEYAQDPQALYRELIASPGAAAIPAPEGRASDYTPAERQAILQQRWDYGGHAMNAVFIDQGTNAEANEIVANFVRGKIRERVGDPAIADLVTPTTYPIGARRLCVDSGYYESLGREDVTVVDLKTEPIVRITPTGIRTTERDIDVDVIVFALGFDAFGGALVGANIRNTEGRELTEYWKNGPATYLGVTMAEFPNLFLLTGPGSPSVLANMFVGNIHQVDFISDLFSFMRDSGYNRVQATSEAQASWTAHAAEVASTLLRVDVDNYMVHVNSDGSRILMPYAGGHGRYAEKCLAVKTAAYEGYVFA